LYLELVTKPEKLGQYLGRNATPEDKAKAIDNFKKDLLSIEKYLRQDKLIQALTAAVSGTTAILSPSFAREYYMIQNAKADVDFIYFDKNLVQDFDVKITDQDIKAYYEKHKQAFKQKPSRRIKYVAIPIMPSREDTTRAIRKITTIIEDLAKASSLQMKDSIFDVKLSEFGGTTHDYSLVSKVDAEKIGLLSVLQQGEISGPVQLNEGTYFFRLDGKRSGDNEVVKASHILIRFGNNRDSAKTEADRIYKELKGGADFAELAAKFSQDQTSAEKGGDLGYFGKGTMIKEFEEACFGNPKGSLLQPTETSFGYHIIKITDKQSDELKYSEIKINPNISNTTKNGLFRNAYSFQKQAEDGAPFDSLAGRLNLKVSLSTFFTNRQPIFGSQYITDKVFDSKIGVVIPPQEIKVLNSIIIAQVNADRSDGYQPIEDVKSTITQKVKEIKKQDIIKLKAETVYKKIAGAGSLRNVQSIDPSLQIESVKDIKNTGAVREKLSDLVFTQKAFVLPLNKISEPVRGIQGYYIMQVTNRQVPDEATIKRELPEYIMTLKHGVSQSEFNVWFSKLKEEADIKDHRMKFYKEY
ncbi:MAG: peptidylprolyl isomerase, partial [Bacteroidota bacterium]